MRYLKTTTIIGLSLLFVACQKQNMEAQAEHGMMMFEPQVEVASGAVTRGTPITAVSQMKDMGVFAYHTGSSTWTTAGATAAPNVMNNLKVEQTAGKWGYAPLKPWLGQYNTLFAYAPYATATNGIAVQSSYTGAPTIEYTVPTTCVDQPDLMVAVRQEDKYLGTVSFAMEHALACVGFKVKGGDIGKKISKIAVKGVSASGTLSLDHTVGGVPRWTSVTAATDIEYTSGIKDDITVSNTLTDAMNVDGYLMMIPQTLGAGAKLIITVDGVAKEAKLDGRTWKAGERYTYNLDVASSDPMIIGIFGDWDDTNKEYTKPLQVEAVASSIDPSMKWSTSNSITKATNRQYGPTNIAILKGLNSTLSNYPAAEYCADKGNGWYLPSQNQLMAIWITYEGIPSEFAFVNPKYYSSSTESTEVNESPINSNYVVFFSSHDSRGGGSSAGNKGTAYWVRCVRDVTP